MSDPLPPDVRERLQARLDPPREPFRVPWGQIILILVGLVAAGWYAYDYWTYRLPQEHLLTDRHGRQLHVNIEGRNALVLKCDWLDDKLQRTVYIPIANLASNDRAFVDHLAANITPEPPLVCLLLDAGGTEGIVTFVDRSDDWVKLVKDGASTESYVPFASFPRDDKAVLGLLPPKLYFSYPMEYVLTGSPAPGVKIKLLGHNEDFVQFTQPVDNIIRYEPLVNFSPADQAIIRELPPSLSVDLPVVHTLTALDGQPLAGTIKAVSSALVALALPGDGSTRYFPIADLSVSDQKFVHILPARLNLALPLACTMADASGKAMRVRIEGRAAKFVKLTEEATGATEFRLLTEFSLEDAKVLQLLPVNYSLGYPFDYALNYPEGQVLKAQILGRTVDTVKYRLVNGAVGTLPMAKLSPHDQEFLTLLPVNYSSGDLGLPPPKPPPESPVVLALRNQIATLEKKNLSLEASIANPNTSALDREFMQVDLQKNKDQLLSLEKKIDAELVKTPPRPN